MAVRFLHSILAAVLAAPLAARGADVVPAERAATVVGSTVTVEGDVAAARLEPDALVLELAPAGPKGFRAVLVLAMISSLPRQPERLYEGKRVRVTGLVQRFGGRPEMVLESAGQIEVVDVAGAPVAGAATTTVPRASLPATTATPPTTLPAPRAAAEAPPTPAAPTAAAPAAAPPAPATPPAPTPAPVAPPSLLAERLRADACAQARARWDDAAARVRTASGALARCVDGGTYRCRAEAKALAPALSDLEWAEQNVTDRCD